MEKQISKVTGLYDICTSLLGNNEENHEESNFINIKAKKNQKKQKKEKAILDITEEMTNGVNFAKHSTNKTALFNRMQQNWKKQQQYIMRHGII